MERLAVCLIEHLGFDRFVDYFSVHENCQGTRRRKFELRQGSVADSSAFVFESRPTVPRRARQANDQRKSRLVRIVVLIS
jgi:hypothetical protein